LAEWEQMKKAFDAAAKKVQNPDALTTSFLAIMAKPTGLTPILKDIDAALAKEQRKPATDALLIFYAKREPFSALIAKVIPKITDDALNNAAMDLLSELPALVTPTRSCCSDYVTGVSLWIPVSANTRRSALPG
ncbi:MAG: hypothetical protein ABIV25_04660, partial [Paracoccaceae bacterium]